MSSGIAPAVRAGLCAQWSYRARAENEASQRFRGLQTRMHLQGIGGEAHALAGLAITDEERHRTACDQEARRWGAATQQHEPICMPAPKTGATPNRRLEFEVVTLCCIAETLNSIYLAEIVSSAKDLTLRARTREILKNEVGHARLGWFFLARGGANLHWLSEEMPRILRSTLHDEVLENGPAVVADADYGLYERSELAALFRAGVEDVVLPGLADHGLDTAPARAWLRSTIQPSAGQSSAGATSSGLGP